MYTATTHKAEQHQPWLHSATLDSCFILAPPLIATALAVWFHEVVHQNNISPWAWVLLIVGIDVAHVYSTLFRSYWNPEDMQARRPLFTAVPILGWVVGTVLYSMGAEVFWRVLAYLAVFHFVRQQYGFIMLYVRQEPPTSTSLRWIDKGAIYLATVYPLLYWHSHLPRPFHWFVEGDFVALPWPILSALAGVAYGLFLLLYVAKELIAGVQLGYVNIPKNLVFAGTALSWYVGIVWCEGDLAFTATNVVAHGIPYMALVWVYGRRREMASASGSRWSVVPIRSLFSPRAVPLYIGILVVMAFLEEGLWDALVWREHPGVFSWFGTLPHITTETTLVWLVPLLALPQITHYVLDGFIWRFQAQTSQWQAVLFQREGHAS